MSETLKRNVLVVAYYFPPMGLSGVQRTLKFVKYLPQFGWQPTVLTVTPTGYFAQDYTLLDEIHGEHVAIERVGSLDPNRLFRKQGVVKMPSEGWRKALTFASDTLFVPDNKIGWRKKAVDAATKLFEKRPFDLIFATAPPFTDFLIGRDLSIKFKKPLIVDYRDPWIEYPYKYYPTPLHRWRNQQLEKSVVHTASRIITTNRRVKEFILQRYHFLDYHDVTILPQGFDPADFETSALPKRLGGRTRFTHAGVFYADRTPLPFLRAMRKVFDEHPSLKQKIEVCFIGNFQDQYKKMIHSLGLEENVILTGYLNHGDCIREVMGSDILWIMLNNDVQSPGKLYEYFGARKPILACVPEGFIRQTLKEVGGNLIIDPMDVDGIANAIIDLHSQHLRNALPAPNEEVVEKYNRISLTNDLSRIFGFLVD